MTESGLVYCVVYVYSVCIVTKLLMCSLSAEDVNHRVAEYKIMDILLSEPQKVTHLIHSTMSYCIHNYYTVSLKLLIFLYVCFNRLLMNLLIEYILRWHPHDIACCTSISHIYSGSVIEVPLSV